MTYNVEFRPSVLKSLKQLPKRDLIRIKSKVDSLCQNLPDPFTTKMKGNNSLHKVRIGNYRIVYEIQNEELIILIIKIGHRKDVYKQLK